MQNTGTLAELPVEGILETIQKDRATGTLHLATPGGNATLYFLFGHLFHAVDAERQGEPVVYQALSWRDGDFTFDTKAKLPAEETIKVSTSELLSHGASPAAEAEAPEAEAAAEARTEPEAEAIPEAPPEAPVSHMPVAPAEDASIAAATEEPAAVEPAATVGDAAAAPRAAAGRSSTPRSGTPRRRSTDLRPGTRPPETMQFYPVPQGELIYESLTAAFVDFPKLLRSLSKDGHSGYVRLSGDEFRAILLFASGSVVEAIYDGHSNVLTGVTAFQSFGRDIDNSQGSLDVIELTPEMVTAIFQLLTGPSIYERLTARFVKVDALLEHLSEEGTSGAMIVRNSKSTGIALLRDGAVLGCYTDNSPIVSTDAAAVLAICKDPAASIEVRGGPVPDGLPVLESSGSGLTTVPVAASPPPIVPETYAAPEIHAAPEAPAPPAAPAPPEAPAHPQAVATPAPPAPDADATQVLAPAGHVTARAAFAGPDPVEPPPVEFAGSNGAAAESTIHETDWDTVISAMAGRADAVLGTRAKKVKELLYSSGHTREDVESTIDRVSELSIMFVDPSKLTALAEDMRQIAAGAS